MGQQFESIIRQIPLSAIEPFPQKLNIALIRHAVVVGFQLLRPSKFEGHCPMIRHGCRMALMV
ncbi:MAG: hypothetical protein BECKG1743D_GA0114223_108501, partial [Candidatus Kentron sp. G]